MELLPEPAGPSTATIKGPEEVNVGPFDKEVTGSPLREFSCKFALLFLKSGY
jgi:hypothetical protein